MTEGKRARKMLFSLFAFSYIETYLDDDVREIYSTAYFSKQHILALILY